MFYVRSWRDDIFNYFICIFCGHRPEAKRECQVIVWGSWILALSLHCGFPSVASWNVILGRGDLSAHASTDAFRCLWTLSTISTWTKRSSSEVFHFCNADLKLGYGVDRSKQGVNLMIYMLKMKYAVGRDKILLTCKCQWIKVSLISMMSCLKLQF